MAYRSSIHSSTGQTPNRMVYGREILLPMAAVIGLHKGENSGTVGDYVKNLQQKLQQVHQLARTNLKKTATYRKKHYATRARSVFSQLVSRCGCTNQVNGPVYVINSLQDGRDQHLFYRD